MPDVLLVTRYWAPSAKARAGQVAELLHPRAAVARYRCPGKAICASVPWACTNRSDPRGRCQQGYCALGRFIVVHVKFACFNLFSYFPNAVHVYDPVDMRVPRRGELAKERPDSEWSRLTNFSGVIALSSFHVPVTALSLLLDWYCHVSPSCVGSSAADLVRR